MNRLDLSVLVILLGACTSRIKVSQFDFTLENCYEVSSDPNHEHYSPEPSLLGCDCWIGCRDQFILE